MLTTANSRLADIIADQESIFVKRQPKSALLAARARNVLAGGVTSSWQITQPQPVWLSHGVGAKVYDADGNEYVDLHGGYGAALAGHAHPAIVRAVRDQVGRGTHFAQPTEDAIVVAGELARRWTLPRWRFANSGTEATMDAVHLMRSYTGRDLIIKVEGGYHGHHDSVQVSVMPDPAQAGQVAGQRVDDPGVHHDRLDDHAGHLPGVLVEQPGDAVQVVELGDQGEPGDRLGYAG